MLLKIKDMEFLSKAVEKDSNGKYRAVDGLNDDEKKKLLHIDEMNFMSDGEHLIENYDELRLSMQYQC